MSDTAKLTEYDFIVVVDASGSMSTEDMPRGMSRWAYMQETATAFARDISKIDSDGIGLVLFGGSAISSYDNVDATAIEQAFATRSPRGGTPLAEALQTALKLAGKSDKKDFVLVFTDGVPDDKEAAAQVLVKASQAIDNDDDLTFLFVQVGYDAAATAFLTKLDDNLKGAKFDIVDTKTIDQAEQFATTVDMLLAAIADESAIGA